MRASRPLVASRWTFTEPDRGTLSAMTRSVTHRLVATLIAAALLAVVGCGDDEKGNGSTDAPATSPAQGDDPGATVDEDRATGPRTERTEPAEPASRDDRRLGSELRDRLREGAGGKGAGFTGADVTGVDIGRTSVTVRTKLDRDAARAASGICAEMRLYLAQEPSRDSADTVTVLGGKRVVLTRC